MQGNPFKVYEDHKEESIPIFPEKFQLRPILLRWHNPVRWLRMICPSVSFLLLSEALRRSYTSYIFNLRVMVSKVYQQLDILAWFNFGYTTWQTSAFCSEMKACKNCLSSIIALLTSWFKLSRNWLKLITSYTYLSLKWQLFLVVVEKRRKKPQRYFKLIERNASSRTRSRHTWLSFLPFFSNYVIAPDF